MIFRTHVLTDAVGYGHTCASQRIRRLLAYRRYENNVAVIYRVNVGTEVKVFVPFTSPFLLSRVQK